MWRKLGEIGWISMGIFMLFSVVFGVIFLIELFIPRGPKLANKLVELYTKRVLESAVNVL